ncbi:MAG: hypothetical protein IJ542_02730 [Clostridia bacterium]|nr:hypothetical protein [Clostridia bacterium]
MEFKDILSKKQKEQLTKEDFRAFVEMLSNGKLSEKQILEFAKMLNSVGCSDSEIFELATAFACSGELLNLSQKFDLCVDKHSAGKVSDGMSLILMSVFPCLGITFVKSISSIYGMYGSMLSRLSAIDGFEVAASIDDATEKAKKCGTFLLKTKIAPASAEVYRVCKKHNFLCEPIVSSTIMSNKIATGANMLVVDVKAGEGAVVDSATSNKIAERIVSVGKLAGINTISIVTDLSWPIASSVGNNLELQEIKDLLSGQKDYAGSSLMALAREMVVCALLASKRCKTRSEATEMFNKTIESGEAYSKFCEIVDCYGGDIVSSDRTEKLIDTAVSYVCAKRDGYVSDIKLGALYDSVNHIISSQKDFDKRAGLILMCREGDKIGAGQKLAKVFYSHENKRYFEVAQNLINSFIIADEKPSVNKLFYRVVV